MPGLALWEKTKRSDNWSEDRLHRMEPTGFVGAFGHWVLRVHLWGFVSDMFFWEEGFKQPWDLLDRFNPLESDLVQHKCQKMDTWKAWRGWKIRLNVKNQDPTLNILRAFFWVKLWFYFCSWRKRSPCSVEIAFLKLDEDTKCYCSNFEYRYFIVKFEVWMLVLFCLATILWLKRKGFLWA